MLQPFGRFLKQWWVAKLHAMLSGNSFLIPIDVRNDNAGTGVAAIGFNVSSATAGETSVCKVAIGLERAQPQGVGDLVIYIRNNTDTTEVSTADEAFRLHVDGRFSGLALHNNAGSMTGTTNQYFGSGSTTSLTAAANTNVSAVTFQRMQWKRDGNVVSGSGALSITPTAAGFCDVKLDLPIALGSAFTDAHQCAGAGATISGKAVYVGVVVSNKMDIAFVATAAVAESVHFSFAYEVAN